MNVRRIPAVLLLLAVSVMASCRSMRYHEVANPCANGSHGDPTPSSPLVCVALENGWATPLIEPVHVYQHDRKGGQTKIHWKTAKDATDLQVSMKESPQSCVTKVNCDRSGNNCVAFVDPNAAPGTSCRYSVWIEGQTKPQDPIIIIDSCCAE